MSLPNVPPGYPSDWNKRRIRVYRRDNYECQSCGAVGGMKGDHEVHAHHIVPLGDDGNHYMSNLITLCAECHERVHEVISSRNNEKVSGTTCVDHEGQLSPASYKCQNCQLGDDEKDSHEFHTHIILPVSEGGMYSSSNLVTLCEECHRSIHENISKRDISTEKKISDTICVECGGNAPSVGEERCFECRQEYQRQDYKNKQNTSSKTTDEYHDNQSAGSGLGVLVSAAGVFLLLGILLYVLYLLLQVFLSALVVMPL